MPAPARVASAFDFMDKVLLWKVPCMALLKGYRPQIPTPLYLLLSWDSATT